MFSTLKSIPKLLGAKVVIKFPYYDHNDDDDDDDELIFCKQKYRHISTLMQK
jgi:hypothetical protein